MVKCQVLFLLLTTALVESCGPSSPPPKKEVVSFTCGSDASNRIVGGQEADQHSIPWQAAIVSTWSKYKPFCGGTIISPYHILTAAHCTWVPNIWVAVGEHAINNFINETHSEDNARLHKVQCIENHPTYDRRPLDNDFAVITLEDPLDLSGSTARAACLPPADLAPFVPAGGSVEPTEFTVSGWGLLKEGGNSQPHVLHHVKVPFYDRTVCDDAYYNITKPRRFLTENMMCAGHAGGGIDSCQGDSGGPLTLTIGTLEYVVGVVSWGIGCGRPSLPGVYAEVTKQLDWIRGQGINATHAENSCPPCRGIFCIFG